MHLRKLRAALITAAVAAASLIVLPAPTSADHDTCGSHGFSGGPVTGRLKNPENMNDYWQHSSSLKRTFTMTQTGGNAYLWVGDATCSTTLCNVYNENTIKSCSISYTGSVVVDLFWFSPNGADVVDYTLAVSQSAFLCSDSMDNDGDGRIDYPADPGCSSSTDDTESPDPQCSDGVNNDGDAWTDYPADPGCTSINDTSEGPNPQCSDGVNNDGDAWTDYPADPGCTSISDTSEGPNPQCSDGVDNDSDGRTDYPSDSGCASIADNQEACAPTVGDVAFCLVPRDEIQRVTVHEVVPGDGGDVGVAGYVETYRFTLPNGTITSLPCVRLLVAGVGVNPCAAAGGVFVARLATLVDAAVPLPDPGLDDPLVTVAVCNADLELTVNGIGINSTPAFAVC